MNKLNKVDCVAIGREGCNNLYYVQTCCAVEHIQQANKKATCCCKQLATGVDLATAKRIANKNSKIYKVKVVKWF